MIKAVLTDLDGVIRHWQNEPLFVLEEQFGLPRGFTFKHAFHKSLLQPAITGQIGHEQWHQKVISSLSNIVPIETATTLVEAWSTTSSTIDASVIQQLKALFPQATLVMISNATSRLEQDLSYTGILKEFDYIVNSSKVGYAKPSETIYLETLKLIGCTAKKSVFIDDLETNVLVARNLGFNSVHFTSKEEAFQQLHKLVANKAST